MNHWNYRVVKRVWHNKFHQDDQDLFEICEVYYDEDNQIEYITEPYITEDSIEDLRETLKLMIASIDKPMVDRENEGAIKE